jgi:site-specific recombinase XerD
MTDLRVAEKRVFIADGKGGHQRLIPVSTRFFTAVASYLDAEQPPGVDTDRVFVVPKGPRRGQALSAKGLDEVLAGVYCSRTLCRACDLWFGRLRGLRQDRGLCLSVCCI